MAFESFVEHIVGSLHFLQQKLFLRFSQISMLLTIYLAVPAGWGSCLPRLAIFIYVKTKFFKVEKEYYVH